MYVVICLPLFIEINLVTIIINNVFTVIQFFIEPKSKTWLNIVSFILR